MTTIADLADPPVGRLVFVYGPPGAGKSTFLVKLLSHNLLDLGRPALFVSTDRDPEGVVEELKRVEPVFEKRQNVTLEFVDAYRGTVGIVSGTGEHQAANCTDLSGLGITIAKVAKSMNRSDLLIVVDSLTPIYLINTTNALKFVQTTLMRYAAEGRTVVVTIDEGCGRREDIVSMASLAAGIIRLDVEDSQTILEVIKYPGISPTKFVFATQETKQLRCRTELTKGSENYQTHYAKLTEMKIRPQLDDWIDILWLQLILWGGIAWDPVRFPRLLYELSKDLEMHCIQNSKSFWTEEDRKTIESIAEKLDVHDAASAYSFLSTWGHGKERRQWLCLPFDNTSTRNTLRFKKVESALCWGLPNVGSPLCFYDWGISAAELNAFDKEGCEWEVFEEQCVGTGHEHCVIVCTTEAPKDFYQSFSKLTADATSRVGSGILNEILARADGKRTVPVRPNLGDLAFLAVFQEVTSVPALSDDRYLMAMRMAAAKAGYQIAAELSQRGLTDEESGKLLERIYWAMKAGRLQIGETVRIFENCESSGIRIGQPLCFFTTGLLNGFFTAKMSRKVRKTKCLGLNDRYCEWGANHGLVLGASKPLFCLCYADRNF